MFRPIIISILMCSGCVNINSHELIGSESRNAEKGVMNLDSWIAIEKFRIKYSDYDDGFIGEGVSDAVGKLLVKDFKTFVLYSNLYGIKFNEFVLKHIDSTISEDDLREIHELTNKCNEPDSAICHQINIEVNNAISDL